MTPLIPDAPCGHSHVTTAFVGDETIVAVAGDIDAAAAPLLRSALREASATGHHAVVIDAALVEFIDAAGLGVILGARRRLGLAGRRLVLRDPSLAVRRVLGVLGLGALVEGESR